MVDKAESMKLDNQLCFALYACSKEMVRRYRPLLDPLGLTYTQYIALLALWESGRLRVKELGSRLQLDSGTLTPLLKKLESLQYIRRRRDPLDERNVWIEVTEEGWSLRKEAEEIPMQILQSGGINLQAAQQLHSDLHQLLNQLNQLLEPAETADKSSK